MALESSFLKTCKCPDGKKIIATKIEIESLNRLNYYRCVDSCPSKYFDIDTNICVEDSCSGNKNKIKKNNGCTDECTDNEFLFTKKLDNGKKIYYCLDKCPEEAKFYVPSIGEKECIEQCPSDKKFYSEKEGGYECSSECENQANIDVENGIYFCTSNVKGNCSNDDSFPYEFQGSCLRDCSDTKKLDYFSNIETFLFYSKNVQRWICSENCEELYNNEIHKSYKVPETQYCVDNCKETNYKFFYGSNCLGSCETQNNLYPYNIYDNGECVQSCSGDYHLLRSKKTCYKEQNLPGKYYLDNSNEWVVCSKPEDPSNLKEGEGYFKDDINSCRQSCDSFNDNSEEGETKVYYNKYGDNKCLTVDSSDEIIGKAYKYGNDKILYNSCKEIQTQSILYTYELNSDDNPYKYECKDYKGEYDICYKISERIFNCLSVTESNGISDSQKADFCLQGGFYYLRDKECVDCTSEEYKIEFQMQDNKVIKLGECLDNNNCHANYTYYSKEEKICRNSCSNKKLKLRKDSEEIVYYEEGNCLNKCPNEYPYEYTDKYNNNEILCLKERPDDCYYYELKDGTKKCIEDCFTVSKYYDGNQCVDECKRKNEREEDYYIYYYINEDGKKRCIDSCMSQENLSGFKHSFEAKNSHQECIEGCPDSYKYYFEDNYTCLDSCLYGYIDTDENGEETNICLHSCLTSCNGKNNHIINGNKCTDKCTENEEPFSVIGSNGVVKCTSTCENEYQELKYYSINESNEKYLCLKTCEKKKFGKQCLDECPKGTYDEVNECKTTCTKPYFEKKIISPTESNGNEGESGDEGNENGGAEGDQNGVEEGNVNEGAEGEQNGAEEGNGEGEQKEKDYYYVCRDSCDNNFIASTGECVDKCPLGENYIGALNKCKGSCSNEDGIFYKDVSTADDTYKIFKCVSNCGSDEYQIEGSKECIKECPYYSSPNGFCYKICLNDLIYSFSAISVDSSEQETKICSTGCMPNTKYKYYGEDKICVEKCTGSSYIINEENNACVSKCDKETDYKFLNEIVEGSDEKEYHCKTSCVGENKKYSLTDYICVDKCEAPNNFVINSKICSDKCNNNQFAVLDDNNEYQCRDSCDLNTVYIYYYKEEKVCLDKCKTGDYLIENTHECISSCNKITDNDYYFYESDDTDALNPNKCVLKCPAGKEYVNAYKHCVQHCNEGSYIYYLESEKICSNYCPEGTYNDTYKCLSSCKLSENGQNKYLDGKNCIDSCENSKVGNKFFYESNLECIKSCNGKDFIYNAHQCVSSCTEDELNQVKMYIDNNRCVDMCPDNKPYFIANFEHGEGDLNRYCLLDCPSIFILNAFI